MWGEKALEVGPVDLVEDGGIQMQASQLLAGDPDERVLVTLEQIAIDAGSGLVSSMLSPDWAAAMMQGEVILQ